MERGGKESMNENFSIPNQGPAVGRNNGVNLNNNNNNIPITPQRNLSSNMRTNAITIGTRGTRGPRIAHHRTPTFKKPKVFQEIISSYFEYSNIEEGEELLNSLLNELQTKNPEENWTLESLQEQIPFVEDSSNKLKLNEAFEQFIQESRVDTMVIPPDDSSFGQITDGSSNTKKSLSMFAKKRVGSLTGSFISEAKNKRRTSNAKKQEGAMLRTHMGASKGPNTLKQDFSALRNYYRNTPEKAKSDFSKAKSKIEKLKQKMAIHYSETKMKKYGQDTLNHMFLTGDKFKKELHNPEILRGIVAMEALKDTGNVEALIADTKDLYQLSVSGILSHSVEISTVSLAMVTPNDKKPGISPAKYKAADVTRRANTFKLQKAFSKACSSVVKDIPEPESKSYTSRFDKGYDATNWKDGGLGDEFLTFADSLTSKSDRDLKKFVKSRGDLTNWQEILEETGKIRAVSETESGINQLINGALKGTGKKAIDLTKDELVNILANGDSWLDPYTSHMCLDKLHFGSVMMLGDELQIKTKDGKISGADLFKGVAKDISEKGVTKKNAVAAEALFSRMAMVKDYAVKYCGWSEFIDKADIPDHIQEMTEEKGEMVALNYLMMEIQLENRIAAIESDHRTYEPEGHDKAGERIIHDPNVKGEYKRLLLLKEAMSKDSGAVADKINEYKDDPMFQFLSPMKFMSFLKASNANMAENPKAEQLSLTEKERVAIFGYTTADYLVLNPALRKAGTNEISDPGLKAYAQYAIDGMEKIPNLPTKDPVTDKNLVLKRALFTVPSKEWAETTFQEGATFQDHAFMSATPVLFTQGVINIKILYEEEDLTNAKDVGPFSAFPGEKEILLMPGTEFTISDSDVAEKLLGGAWVVLKPKVQVS